MNENSIGTFYVLDLDRTLYNTIKGAKIMEEVISLHNTELAVALAQRFREASSLGESFAIRDFIVEIVGEDEMQKIEVAHRQTAREQDLLNPGARELIAYIRAKKDAELGILTYGSLLGQTLKMAATLGLEHIPYLITSETFKATFIASWRQDDGFYHVPDELGGFVAREIVFVDDKPFSFKGLAVDCRGYLVKGLYDAGIETIPDNVTVVTDLFEVVASEKKHAQEQ